MVRMQRITALRGDGIWQALDVAFEGPQLRNIFTHSQVSCGSSYESN